MNAQTTALAVAEPRPARVPLVAGNSPRAIVPTDFEGAWRISQAVVAAQMAPKSLRTVEACAVAILHGLEIGLTPMNALQSIAVINGRPSLWGDGAIGVIQASGQLEDQDEHYEGDENTDAFKAVCILKRKGKARPYVGEFSIADARKAGLLGKEGPWQGYRKRMMKMRARAFAMRDGFSDVLKGMSVAEEQEDVERAAVTTIVDDGGGPPNPANDDGGGPPVPTEGGSSAAEDDGGGPPVPSEETVAPVSEERLPAETVIGEVDDGIPEFLRVANTDKPTPAFSDDEQDWLDELETEFSGCSTMEELSETHRSVMAPYEGSLPTPTWNAAVEIMDQHTQRIQAAG